MRIVNHVGIIDVDRVAVGAPLRVLGTAATEGNNYRQREKNDSFHSRVKMIL